MMLSANAGTGLGVPKTVGDLALALALGLFTPAISHSGYGHVNFCSINVVVIIHYLFKGSPVHS